MDLSFRNSNTVYPFTQKILRSQGRHWENINKTNMVLAIVALMVQWDIMERSHTE